MYKRRMRAKAALLRGGRKGSSVFSFSHALPSFRAVRYGKRRQADLHAPRRSNARGGLHERALLRGHHAFRHIIGGKPRENRFRLRFPRSIRHDRVGLRQHQTHRKVAGLLKNTSDTVLSVAAACGYNNTANFNRIFRKITGLTPKQYRKSRSK